MFRPRRARPVWGVVLGQVSDQSDHSPPPECRARSSGFTGNAGNIYRSARNGVVDYSKGVSITRHLEKESEAIHGLPGERVGTRRVDSLL